jgi:hypothetical protein
VADHLPPEANTPGHLTDDQIAQYRRGHAAPQELLVLDDHLAACAECRSRLGGESTARDLLRWEDGLQRYNLEPEHAEQKPAPMAPRGRPLVWIPAAAAAALVLAFVGWQALRTKNQAPLVAVEKYRVVLRDSGFQVALRDDGSVVAPPVVADAGRALIADALRTGALPMAPPDPELASRTVVLRGRGNRTGAFAVLAPVGAVLLSDRPEFQWEPLNGAQSYRVQVYDSEFHEVATSGTLKLTTWRPERALQRGKLFQWQVTALRNGEAVRAPAAPAPEARFRVVDEPTAARIETGRPSHLLTALLCARAGLRDDARRELEAVLAENPDSELVKKLIASLQ